MSNFMDRYGTIDLSKTKMGTGVQDAKVCLHRGSICANEGYWQDAAGYLNRAIALKPDYAEAYLRRGLLYETMQRRSSVPAEKAMYVRLIREDVLRAKFYQDRLSPSDKRLLFDLEEDGHWQEKMYER